MSMNWRYVFSITLVFLLGGIAFTNLAELVPINESYQTSWEKVVMAVIFAIGFAYKARFLND